MGWRAIRVFVCILLAAMSCALIGRAALGADAPDKTPPAKVPAGDEAAEDDAEKFKDSLITGYDDSFILQGKWAEGLKYYEEELLKVLTAAKPDLTVGQRLLYAHDVCRLFPAIATGVPSPNDRPFAEWLLRYPKLVRLLGAAVQPEDDAAGVFRVLYLLKTKGGVRKPAFANLMVAFAIVYDKEVKEADLEGDGGKIVERFRYYVDNATEFHDNPKSIPYFMLKYVVDNDVTAEERDWVLERYGRAITVVRLYSSVPYDTKLFQDGESKDRTKLEEKGHTLKNIKKYGGLCGDQAHFATRVSKSLCIPAATFDGRDSRTGTAHTWASAARKTGDGWRWMDGGRFGGTMVYTVGESKDPQTGEAISDRDCWLQTQLSRVNVVRRLRSRFCLTSAILLEKNENIKRAAVYLRLAVQVNPYNIDAWMMIARFCSEKKLNATAIWSFYEQMVERFKEYPQFTKDILEQLRGLIPENKVNQHLKLYDMTWEIYQKRHPNIGAEILAEKGDYLMTRGQPKAAFKIYVDALMRYRRNVPIMKVLLERVEKAYRSQDAVKSYVKVVERVMSTYRDQRTVAMKNIGYRSSAFYQLAKHLHELYVEIGDKRKARIYKKLLEPLN